MLTIWLPWWVNSRDLIKDLFDRRQEGEDAIQRYENIQELLNSIKEFTETPSNEEGEVGDKGLRRLPPADHIADQ